MLNETERQKLARSIFDSIESDLPEYKKDAEAVLKLVKEYIDDIDIDDFEEDPKEDEDSIEEENFEADDFNDDENDYEGDDDDEDDYEGHDDVL